MNKASSILNSTINEENDGDYPTAIRIVSY